MRKYNFEIAMEGDDVQEQQKALAFAELLNGFSGKSPASKDMVSGTVVSENKDGFFVSFPHQKTDGFVPKAEASDLHVGDSGEFLVLAWPEEGTGVVSRKRAIIWSQLIEQAQSKEPVVGTVCKLLTQRNDRYPNRLLIGVGQAETPSVFGVLPLKEVPLNVVHESLIGRTLELQVLHASPKGVGGSGTLVFVLTDPQRQMLMDTGVQVTAGEIVTGSLREIIKIGKEKKGTAALIDLDNGVTAFLHATEVNGLIKDALRRGEQYEFVVTAVDEKTGSVRVSLKQVQALRTLQELKVGTRVIGRVVNKTTFGYFIDLGNGLDGLLHVSAVRKTKEGPESFNKKDEVEVLVTEVDRKKNRISLSRRF